jgi:hypothetical protein
MEMKLARTLIAFGILLAFLVALGYSTPEDVRGAPSEAGYFLGSFLLPLVLIAAGIAAGRRHRSEGPPDSGSGVRRSSPRIREDADPFGPNVNQEINLSQIEGDVGSKRKGTAERSGVKYKTRN